jgi:hypothetical protein
MRSLRAARARRKGRGWLVRRLVGIALFFAPLALQVEEVHVGPIRLVPKRLS